MSGVTATGFFDTEYPRFGLIRLDAVDRLLVESGAVWMDSAASSPLDSFQSLALRGLAWGGALAKARGTD